MEKGPLTPDFRDASAAAGPICPDPEVLAAWVDHGLGDAERASVAAHLSGCTDCRLLMSYVLETRDAVGDLQVGVRIASGAPDIRLVGADRTDPPLPALRSRRVLLRWSAGAMVAAAATLFVVVQSPPSWWPLRSSTGVDSRLADLADAVGQERTVEARLSGGFRHGPLRAPVRSGGSLAPTDNWTLLGVAGRIREAAEQDPNAANLHALGLAHLVLGQHDEAVRALEDAVAEASANAQYQSDLAAAYLSRAKQAGRADDLPRALSAAERAIAADAQLAEPLFNRALALEALFLEDQARRAWNDYLSRDSQSTWAEEARRHLAALQQGAAAPVNPSINSPPAIDNESVEAGLDWLLRLGLPGWAEAVLSGNAPRASQEQSRLTTYAQQVSDVSGDPFAVTLASELFTSGSVAHAQAVRDYADGLKQLDDPSLAPFAEASFARGAAAAPNALAALCVLELGAIDTQRRRPNSAERRVNEVFARARLLRSKYFEGRAFTLAGFRAMFAGDSALIGTQYQRAQDLCESVRFKVCAGNAAMQRAELLALLGATVDAWQLRLAVLQQATDRYSGRLALRVYAGAGSSLARQGDYHVSRAFLIEADALAARYAPWQQLLISLARARAAFASGEFATAHRFVDDVIRVIEHSSDSRAKGMRVDAVALRGAVALAEGDTTTALADLTAAIDGMGSERQRQKADAHLTRAIVLTRTGSESAGAEADLGSALTLIEKGLAADGQVHGELSGGRAVATVIASNADLQSVRGLFLAERFRELSDQVSADRRLGAAQQIEDKARQLNAGSQIVFFLPSEEGILTWVLSRDGVTFVTRPVSHRRVERLTATLALQVERTPQNEALWKDTLRTLYDELLAGLPGIDEATSITVIPEGPLYRVPFSALVDGQTNRFLFERSTVIVSPNLAYALEPREAASAVHNVLVVGEPFLPDGSRNGFAQLPGAKDEALRIASSYSRASALIGRDATTANVVRALANADIFHFSGHAVVPPGNGRPRLLLSGSVADTAHGLDPTTPGFRIKRGAHVILAGCETGATSNDRTTGIRSVAAGFLHAGARSVVGSLWSLDDTGAEDFFVRVHEQLKDGRQPATAVTLAQRACLADTSCRTTVGTWIGTVVYSAME
jgi:CHAT domain-containing protein